MAVGRRQAYPAWGPCHPFPLPFGRSQRRSVLMSSGENDSVSSKILLTFSIVILTPVLLMVIFEKLQFPLIKGIGGF